MGDESVEVCFAEQGFEVVEEDVTFFVGNAGECIVRMAF